MAFTVPNRMWHNPAIGAAVNSVSNAFFGKTDRSGLDPSAIYENEQQALAAKALAAQREAQTNLYNQQHSAIADFMTNPDYHYTQMGSNYNQYQSGTSERNQREYWEGIRDNYVSSPEARAEAAYMLSGAKMPGAGTKYGGYGIDTRDQRIADVFTEDRWKKEQDIAGMGARNDADNIRALATNKADNIRALQEAELTNESNIFKTILAPVQAGARRFNPPSIVEKYGVDAIQATPAKPTTTTGASATTYEWGPYDESQVDKTIASELTRLTKLKAEFANDELRAVPVEMWAAIPRLIRPWVTDKNQKDGKHFKKANRATQAIIDDLTRGGLTEIPGTGEGGISSLWGGGEPDIQFPTSILKQYQFDLKEAREAGKEQESLKNIINHMTDPVSGWGIPVETAQKIMEFILADMD